MKSARVTRGPAAAALHRYWYALAALVRRDLQQRYARTVIGLGWAAVQPLVLMALYLIVFTWILKVRTEDGQSPAEYALFMVCGMLPFLAISEGLNRAAWSLRDDRALLDRVAFPAETVPAARVVSAAVAECMGLALLAIAVGAFTHRASLWLLLLPVLVLLRIVITLGFAWLLSPLAVFIGDLAEFLGVALTVWMFLTPIFYAPEAVPPALRWSLALNPLHHVVLAYRRVVLDGTNPMPAALAVVGWAVVLGGLGLWFFRKTLDRAKDFL
jgi:ABC-type polysaccharide/polyol phosphate export permease